MVAEFGGENFQSEGGDVAKVECRLGGGGYWHPILMRSVVTKFFREQHNIDQVSLL